MKLRLLYCLKQFQTSCMTKRFSFAFFGLLAILGFTPGALQAQDIHFSQFFEAPLLRNPALAGIFSGDIRLQSVYRSQWNTVTDAYLTASLNGEYKKPIGNGDDFLTLGGQIIYDKAGTIALTSTHAMPVINYHKSLSADRNSYVSLGFMGGVVQRRFDQSKMTTNSQYNGTSFDPNAGTGENFNKPSYTYFDASVGLSFNTQLGENENNNIFLGASYQHFNKASKISFYGNTAIEMIPKWTGSIGLRMNMNDYSFFTFHGDYSKQGTYQETIAGIMYSYKVDDLDDPKYIVHGGAFFRWKDALVPVAKLDFKPFALSVSYDVNVSQLKSASNGRGGLEMALSYQKYLDRSNSSKEAVRCPVF